MKGSPLRFLFPVLLLGLLFGQGYALLRQHASERSPHIAAPIGSEPGFRLQAADGHEVTEGSLHGHWALICFASTRDAEPLRRLAGAMGALGRQTEQVEALFVATDRPPVSPEEAGRVAGGFGHGIIGLSGDAKALDVAEAGFGFRAGVRSLVPGEAPVVDRAGPVIAVLGPDGKLRDALPGSSNPETIAARLRTLGLGDRTTGDVDTGGGGK